MENTVGFEKLSSNELVSVVGGSHSRNYYNGRGTGRNIRAAGTVANVVWTGVKIISHFLG